MIAYSVAEHSKAIKENTGDVCFDKNKWTLIAAVTNGTAVPGLGNIGPLAAKPYMDSLASVYKAAADLDLFDIEINSRDLKVIKQCILSFQPTFGGVLLAGINAPDCYTLLSSLKQEMNIPVMLEATGIAVALGAALLNVSKVKGKPLDTMRIACFGRNDLKKAVIEQLLFLGVDPLYILSSKTGCYEYAVSVAKYSDILLMFDSLKDNQLQLIKDMPCDPVIAVLNKDYTGTQNSLCEIRSDAIIIPLDPLEKNGIDAALVCPYLFRSAIRQKTRITIDMLKTASITLAKSIDDTTIIKSRILLPVIIKSGNMLEKMMVKESC